MNQWLFEITDSREASTSLKFTLNLLTVIFVLPLCTFIWLHLECCLPPLYEDPWLVRIVFVGVWIVACLLPGRLAFKFLRVGLSVDEAALYCQPTSIFQRGSSYPLVICQRVRTSATSPLQVTSISVNLQCTQVILQRNSDGTTREVVNVLHTR